MSRRAEKLLHTIAAQPHFEGRTAAIDRYLREERAAELKSLVRWIDDHIWHADIEAEARRRIARLKEKR